MPPVEMEVDFRFGHRKRIEKSSRNEAQVTISDALRLLDHYRYKKGGSMVQERPRMKPSGQECSRFSYESNTLIQIYHLHLDAWDNLRFRNSFLLSWHPLKELLHQIILKRRLFTQSDFFGNSWVQKNNIKWSKVSEK